jgi:uncharacterized protein
MIPIAIRPHVQVSKPHTQHNHDCSCRNDSQPPVELSDTFSLSPSKTSSVAALRETGSRTAEALLGGFPLPANCIPRLAELAKVHDPGKVTHVIYHGGCPDGFGAALGAWKALGDGVEYIGAAYNEAPPELPKDARVAILDFSYPRKELLELQGRVEDLIVLDHHKSAAKNLDGLDFAVFDMERAGAGLAWHYFHPDKPLPPLMAYLEDRDLWNNELPQTREVTMALRKHPQEFEGWNKLNVEELKAEGVPLVEALVAEVEKVCDTAHTVSIDGNEVPAVRHRRYASDIGNRLLEKFPEAPFAGVYNDYKGQRKWELRSRGDVDVSAICAKFGGGGHKAAGGFLQGEGVEIPGSLPKES